MFRTEDDKYELDMCINSNASAIKAMEPLAHAIEALPPDERPNYKMPPDALNAIHYRAVQRIYGEQPGEQGAYVVDLLRKNPGVAIPVVLGRLLQKDAEWYVYCIGIVCWYCVGIVLWYCVVCWHSNVDCGDGRLHCSCCCMSTTVRLRRQVREEMKETWHRVYEQNYHKSLDHRSFYFKQTEKKNLGAKTMLQVRMRVMRMRVVCVLAQRRAPCQLCIPASCASPPSGDQGGRGQAAQRGPGHQPHQPAHRPAQSPQCRPHL